MCLLNVKHQCQQKLAILPSNGYLISVCLVHRQRCLICLLSQFKDDNSANLILFKQFNLIISSFRSYLLFRSFLFNNQQILLFNSLSKLGSLSNASSIHKEGDFSNKNKKNKTRSTRKQIAQSDSIFLKSLLKNSKKFHCNYFLVQNSINQLEKHQHRSSFKFKIKKATNLNKLNFNFNSSSPEIAKLIRHPHLNSFHYQKNQNCINNLKRPTISDQLKLNQIDQLIS